MLLPTSPNVLKPQFSVSIIETNEKTEIVISIDQLRGVFVPSALRCMIFETRKNRNEKKKGKEKRKKV